MSDQTERLKKSVKDLSATQKEIQAELRAEDAALEYDRVLEEYAGRVNLKGFRRGKAPRDMVRQMFLVEIRKSVLDALIPKVLEEVIVGENIRPVGPPSVSEIAYEPGQSLRFKSVVEIWPEFELPVYKKIKVKKRTAEVAEEDITKALEELREKAAEYVPVEGRGAVKGDYVALELQGRERKTKRLMPTEKVAVIAGLEGNDPAVNENLSGMKPLEEKTFTYAYPDEAPNKKLAGKEIEYRLKVISIKEKRVSALDNDFAKTLGDYDSLAALREKIGQEIRSAREQGARRDTSEDILQELTEKTSIELPSSVVEEEAEVLLEKMLSSGPPQRLTEEAVEALRQGSRRQAERNLRRNLILRKIADAEGIKVEDADVDHEIQELAKANNIPLARLMDSFSREDRRENLKRSLLLRKTVDFLVEQAIIE